MPRIVTSADSAGGSPSQRNLHPVIGLGLGCLAGLIPFLGPPTHSLEAARWAGIALAGGAAAFVMRRSRPRGIAAVRLRKRLALLLVASLPSLSLLYGFRVIRIETGDGPVAVPLGFWRKPYCCKAMDDDVTCVKRELGLDKDEAAIRYCWGDGPVNTVRSGLVLSLWGTALACGGLIGLFLIREQEHASASVERAHGPAVAPPPSYDLFLSYSTKDQDFVQCLAGDLEDRKIAVWWARPEIQVGESFVASIGQALSRSRRFAIVLSPASLDSRWVATEMEAALALENEREERFMIPLLYQTCDIPVLLKHRRYIDFSVSYERGLAELLGQLVPGCGSQTEGAT